MKWLGGTICDICTEQIKETLYDSKTVHGPWATLCEPCWKEHTTMKLGIGRGQKYAEGKDGFTKVS